ncbi:MAG: 4-vinyl reductase [Deltaproteobacteria bacterium]|jgi:predicted hydrocarbon binding protein|nr:4-vinyl reductase [Deltaproteobacteria bacterium]
MKNIFAEDSTHSVFSWEKLGNIKEGRGDLGEDMPVLVYRLMQYTMLDVLSDSLGTQQANEYFRKAGFLAGTAFAKNMLDLSVKFNDFVASLQKQLKDLKICILRIEDFDVETGNIVLTAGQDLDCSGLPVTDETVCNYDEGFISGILQAYSGKKYNVREVDCWANGDRVCRFKGVPESE